MFKVDSMEVARKLEQMDDEISFFLERLTENKKLTQERILFLMFGDHGMKLDGEHGGGSKEEVETVLLALDVQQLRNDIHTGLSNVSDSSCRENLPVSEMNQIDLTASLAFLLDIPIPYSSIGKVSLDLLQLGASGQDTFDAVRALCINAWQVWHLSKLCLTH